MSAKLFVFACSSIIRPPIIFSLRCATSPSPASSLPYSPIRGITSFTPRKCSAPISCISTMEGNSESLPVGPKSVQVQVAHELLQAGHRYLDVRTPEEFSAGHVAGAINVPVLFRVASGTGRTKNPNFLEGISAHFSKEDEIVVGCQTGKRSLMAATDLISAGYTGVTDMAGGYVAWTQNGLPIES